MKKVFLIFVLTLLETYPAYALKISPFKTSIEASAESKTKVFRLENNSDEPTAVQVSVQTWEIGQDGKETNKEAGDEFAVFPAQIILQPHESRGVRVQWLGTEVPRQEKSYRVLAEQIPIHLKETLTGVNGVKFMLRFKAALYVTPQDAKSDVIVSNYKVMPDNVLRVDITNNGTAHTIIKNPTMILLSNTDEMMLKKNVLTAIDGENVHAGKTRTFDIILNEKIPDQITNAKITFDSGL